MLSDAFPTAIYNVLIIPKMTLARTRCSIFLQQCNFFFFNILLVGFGFSNLLAIFGITFFKTFLEDFTKSIY